MFTLTVSKNSINLRCKFKNVLCKFIIKIITSQDIKNHLQQQQRQQQEGSLLTWRPISLKMQNTNIWKNFLDSQICFKGYTAKLFCFHLTKFQTSLNDFYTKTSAQNWSKMEKQIFGKWNSIFGCRFMIWIKVKFDQILVPEWGPHFRIWPS